MTRIEINRLQRDLAELRLKVENQGASLEQFYKQFDERLKALEEKPEAKC